MPWAIKPIFGFSFDKIIQKIHKTKYIIFITSFVNFYCYLMFSFYPLNPITFLLIKLLNVITSVFTNIICEYLLVLSTKKAN